MITAKHLDDLKSVLTNDEAIDLLLQYGEQVTVLERKMNAISLVLEDQGISVEEEIQKRENKDGIKTNTFNP